MMSMKLLAVATTMSIYYGCSNRKTLWEGRFTLGEFTDVNINSVVVEMLVNIEISKVVTSMSPWTYR